MLRFIKKILLFIIIIIVVNYPISYFFEKWFATTSKQTWIFEHNGENYDIATIGSSRVLNMIDTKLMSDILMKKAINLGTNGSNFAEHLLILNQFLKTNKIKYLLLNTDQFSFNSKVSYFYPFHEYEFLRYFFDEETKYIFKDYLPVSKYYLWHLFPLIRYIEYFQEYDFLYSNSKSKLFENYDTQRGSSIPKKNREAIFNASTQQLRVDEMDKKYFHRIINLCEQNNVSIIFITTPMPSHMDKFKLNSNLSYDFIKQISDSLKIPYLHFNDIGDFSDSTYFYDMYHTNNSGSIYYTQKLSEKITKLINSDLN